MTKTSDRYAVLLPLLLGLNFGILFFDRNALNFLMPFIQPELKLSFTQIGLLSSAMAFTWAASGFIIGRVSERTGRKKIFIVAAGLAFSACSFLSGLAGSFLALLGARLLMGAAEGMVLPLSHAIVALEVPAERRGLAMGVTQNLGSCFFGAFLAPILLPMFALAFGWRGAFYIAGVPGLILAVLIWIYVREPEVPAVREHEEILGLGQIMANRNMIICTGMAILMVSYLVIANTFLPLYLTQKLGFAPRDAGWLMGVLGLSATLGSFVVPALSDRIGRRPVMIAVPFIGLLLPLGAMYAQSSFVILAPLFFAGWGFNSIFSLFMATIPSESLPVRYVATAAGVVMGIGEIIGGVGSPFVAGWAADVAGLDAVMWIIAGITVAAGIIAMGLVETRKHATGLPDAITAV